MIRELWITNCAHSKNITSQQSTILLSYHEINPNERWDHSIWKIIIITKMYDHWLMLNVVLRCHASICTRALCSISNLLVIGFMDGSLSIVNRWLHLIYFLRQFQNYRWGNQIDSHDRFVDVMELNCILFDIQTSTLWSVLTSLAELNRFAV